MPYLLVTTGPSAGSSYHLRDAPLVAGREANRDLQILDPKVSRKHFTVRKTAGGGGTWEIEELDAKNGVLVNGTQVRHAVLNDGDTITVGDTEILFRAVETRGEVDKARGGRVLSKGTTAPTIVTSQSKPEQQP